MTFNYIKQALQIVWKSSKKWTILLLGTQLLQAILPLLLLYLTKLIVDELTVVDSTTNFLMILDYILRPVQILRNLTDLLRSSFLLLSLAGLLLYLHWSIAVILCFFALPIAHYLNHILTTTEYAKEVRLFNLGKPLKEQFLQLRKVLFGEKLKIGKQRARASLLAKGAEIVAMTGTYGFIAWRTFHGTITIGDLVMYFQAFQRGQAAIQQSLTSVVGLYNNRLFLSHLFELLNITSLLKIPKSPKNIPENLTMGIHLDAVSFTYPDTSSKVLQDVNLSFKKGEVVALVGENGSGKTTLVKLLCRLYDPTEGTIHWGKDNIKHFKLTDLRQKISVIYQDFAKYFFSVNKNVQIADLEQPNSPEKIQAATSKSGATDFIEQLPDKYEQQLGRLFRKGAELSGGQWQKMALARAFYKNAEIIILDEPSSAIDPLAEATIFEHFRTLAKDKILVLVTHRLYNLKMADKIVVLQKGRVVEVGSHDALVAQKGLYWEMFEKQVD